MAAGQVVRGGFAPVRCISVPFRGSINAYSRSMLPVCMARDTKTLSAHPRRIGAQRVGDLLMLRGSIRARSLWLAHTPGVRRPVSSRIGRSSVAAQALLSP